MGEFPEKLPVLQAIARLDRLFPRLRLFPLAFAATLKLRPKLASYIPLMLHETLGAALPGDARSTAALWGLCHAFIQNYGPECVERAGIKDEGAGLAEAMFQKILASDSGVAISTHDYADTWKFIEHQDGKVHLVIPELIEEIRELSNAAGDEEYPLVLLAGERRSYNANTICREEDWRKQDPDGSLKIHPDDARRFDINDGDTVLCESRRGEVTATVSFSDEMRPGVISLPHGYGMDEPEDSGSPRLKRTGPAINWLTSSDNCDAIAKTPLHKFVQVRLRVIEPRETAEPATAAVGVGT
jgi:hypothetical protein